MLTHTIPEKYLWHTIKGQTDDSVATVKIFYRDSFYYLVSEINTTPLQLPSSTTYLTLMNLAKNEIKQRLKDE